MRTYRSYGPLFGILFGLSMAASATNAINIDQSPWIIVGYCAIALMFLARSIVEIVKPAASIRDGALVLRKSRWPFSPHLESIDLSTVTEVRHGMLRGLSLTLQSGIVQQVHVEDLPCDAVEKLVHDIRAEIRAPTKPSSVPLTRGTPPAGQEPRLGSRSLMAVVRRQHSE